MTTGTTSLLGLALPVEGELDGEWGDVVNYGITDYVDIAIAGTLTLNGDGAITLANTNGTASGTNIGATTAQYAIIKVTGTLTTTKVITAPSYSKPYIVDNAATGGTVTFKASGQTGISVAVGEKCAVYFNGTDYVKVASSTGISTSTANTFTATQTFSGSSSVLAMVLNDAAEVVTVSATAATGTINFDVTTQSVLYYTTNASANWTLNVRASSGTSLNTALATGQSVTIAFLVTQGSTAYYQSAFQVDGSAVTPKWQGGTAPTAGNASSVDIYTVTIIKTGSAAFSAFASQTRFA